MSVTLDGQALFDELDLKIELDSPTRAAIERTAFGLDGMLSIDLGERPRRIRQTGVLRAVSQSAMCSRINSIADFIDAQTHTLVTTDGQEYGNLRMDTFKQTVPRAGGPGAVLEYEIVYTQLGS